VLCLFLVGFSVGSATVIWMVSAFVVSGATRGSERPPAAERRARRQRAVQLQFQCCRCSCSCSC
jgi:hypothetical protein